MKKCDLKSLALLGLASGLCITSPVLATEKTSVAMEQALANKCGGPHGCGGALATREMSVWERSCRGSGGCSGVLAERETSSKMPYASPDTKEATENSTKSNPSQSSTQDFNDGNLGYHLMTEDELMVELNNDGTHLYKSLNSNGKNLALQVASSRCQGTNECKGLNACKTEEHDCAGKGSCKGQGKCAMADKNLAVQLVYQKMGARRASALRE